MIKQIINLKAREDFICLGSDCPRDCCHGWDNIEIDTNTIEKWSTTQDLGTKEYLMSFIDTVDVSVSIMSKTTGKLCAALNENKLCSIQLQYGHDYLSETCRNFPRINLNNYFRGYNSASFSCPAIVNNSLFNIKAAPIFSITEIDTSADHEVSDHEKILYDFDNLLNKILDSHEHPIGNILFFVSDIFSNIINMSRTGNLTENTIQQLHDNTDMYLTNISKAIKLGKLKPNPVTSGSFWKNIYDLCLKHNISENFLDDHSSTLARMIKQCDDTFPGYSKVYAAVNQYRKKANKQIKQQYNQLFRNYIKIMFVNKGFPLSPKHELDMVLVDCMTNICAMQLLLWIEADKNGRLTDDFIKNCIVEVDRKFVSHDGVIKGLDENPEMIQIDKYCNSFIDLF